MLGRGFILNEMKVSCVSTPHKGCGPYVLVNILKSQTKRAALQ